MIKQAIKHQIPESAEKPVLAVSVGDINGIGPELILSTFCTPGMLTMCTPVVFANGKILAYYKKMLGLDQASFQLTDSLENLSSGKLHVWQQGMPMFLANPGERTLEGAKAAFASLEAATQAVLDGYADALITAPLDKSYMVEAGMDFPGHTEYLAAKAGGKSMMVMCGESLRVALLTGHVPLEKVPEGITQEKVIDCLERFERILQQDFAIRRPKIAVLSLNPHAGDQGRFGRQEQEVLAPSIAQLRQQKNMLVAGPFASDGFFGSGNFKHFDGVLAMYHDQGLTGFKSLTGFEGVNYTGGLSLVRVSPDHGPAFDLAGKGQADERSFRMAVYQALDIWRARNMHAEITANPLKIQRRRERERDE